MRNLHIHCTHKGAREEEEQMKNEPWRGNGEVSSRARERARLGKVKGEGEPCRYSALSIHKRGTREEGCTAELGGGTALHGRLPRGTREEKEGGPGMGGRERGCWGPGSKLHVEAKGTGCRTASGRAVRRRTAAAGRGRSKGRSDRRSDRPWPRQGRSDRP